MKSQTSNKVLTLAHIERRDEYHIRDGRKVWVRPIESSDAGPIAGTFALLNEDEVRKRFLHPIKALSEKYLKQLTEYKRGHSFAVVVAEPYLSGTAMIGGVARIAKDDTRNSAEFGILVSHYVAGQGLGRILMKRLIEWCRFYKIEVLWGDVMDDNTAMLNLAQSLGFEREARHTTQGITRISLRFQ
jgi:RimJ/RimL family protein N-acetyltransferase